LRSTTRLAAIVCPLVFSTAPAWSQPASIDGAVADGSRPSEDRLRDLDRKPAEVVTFAGIKSGMTVAELVPGSGYYTRILAKAVGPKGKVYAFLPTAVTKAVPSTLDNAKALAAAYPNVQLVVGDLDELPLLEKVDLIWTTENYHDFHIPRFADIRLLDRAVFDHLKPGGIFLVEDHSADESAGADVTFKLHRIQQSVAENELKAAGFQIEARSDILRNAADDRELPSSDSHIRDHTDRFLLRLRRP
jgi:predicted methyltransferase